MSTQIPTAFVKQFSANVFHLAQQQESRLKTMVRNETQQSKAAFYDRIGTVSATKKTTRHSDTPQSDTPHSRRRVTLVDYERGDMIDEVDKLRLLQDPASQYTIAFSRAMGRAIDDEIIAALGGDAFGGEDGGTLIDWEDLTATSTTRDQRLFSEGGGVAVNLNLNALRRAKKILDENEVDENEPRHWAVSASQIESLLNVVEITDSDFNTVKALVRGEVDTYMGFEFIRTQRLPRLDANIATGLATNGKLYGGAVLITATASRRTYAWAEEGVMLSTAQDIKMRVGERADKSFSMQVYASMSLGATRLEEAKVVEVVCTES